VGQRQHAHQGHPAPVGGVCFHFTKV
jgi:hypothetical protein